MLHRHKPSDRFEDAREYYDFLLNRRTVKFHPHSTKCDPKEYPPFELVLNSKISYDKMAEKVGEHLKVDPTHLRFYTVHATNGNPRMPIKRAPTQSLFTILNPQGYGQLSMNQRNDALYFEVLDMSLAEMDSKKSVKLTWLSEGITKEARQNVQPIRLPCTNAFAGTVRHSRSQERRGVRPHTRPHQESQTRERGGGGQDPCVRDEQSQALPRVVS